MLSKWPSGGYDSDYKYRETARIYKQEEVSLCKGSVDGRRKVRLGWLLAAGACSHGRDGFFRQCSRLGDEGMWLFNNPPKKVLKEKHGFEPDQAWFEHLQRSSVRFNSGGSGSFVSSNGLVLTNHHIGADALQKLSTKDKNYLAEGFYAKTQDRGNEVRRPGIERAHEYRRRHGAGQRGRSQARHVGRVGKGPPRDHEHHRAGIDRKDGPAERCRHAVQRRAVPSLSLQEVYRCPPGLRSRGGRRLLRRRPGQFRISPL